MKLFSNLPNTLRVLFGTLRIVVMFFGIVWFLVLAFGPVLQGHFQDRPKLMVTAGEVMFLHSKSPLGIHADGAQSDAMDLGKLHGSLSLNLAGGDREMVSAARWAIFPAVIAGLVYAWMLLGLLRDICANIGRGEIFSERNLRLVRGIGLTIVAFALIGGGIDVWSNHVMGGYLRQHEVMAAVQAGLPVSDYLHVIRFSVNAGLNSVASSVVLGLLVLVMTEVFRQGLKLKAENDLTV